MEQSDKSPLECLEAKNLDGEEMKQGQQPKGQSKDPRVAILLTIQNNLFTDAALQNIGYVLLGTAVRMHPEINDPDKNPVEIQDRFSAMMEAEQTDKYKLDSRHMVSFRMCELLDNVDMFADVVGHKVLDTFAGKKIVPGTLRVLAKMDDSEMIALHLIWIEEK